MANTNQAGSGDTTYTVRAVERVCNILDMLQEQIHGASLGEIAEVTRLPKSSVFRYLWTLEQRRYVRRDPATEKYQLGLAFLPIRARQYELLVDYARPFLEELRDRFQETINIGHLDGTRIAYLDVVESAKPVRLAAHTGDRDPIHSTALGKAIAAHLPLATVHSILRAEGMPRLTAATITDPDVYLNTLEDVRTRGYALDNLENEEDGRCVAVPLIGNRLIAALSLSAPSARFPLERAENVAAALTEVSARIAREMSPGRVEPTTQGGGG